MSVNNNKIVYYDENVPDYYVNGSRDFQLLTRLLTFALNSGKVEAEQLLYLNDALLTNNNLLSLLQTKVGFWSNFDFTDDSIRLVCDVFDLIVRKKGSRKGIIEAIEIYLRTIGISTDFDIFIQNKDVDGNPVYKIDVGINALWHDYTLLSEILRYILPTGYILNIYFYDKIAFIDKSILYSDLVLTTASDTYNISKIRNAYYSSTTEDWKILGAKVVDANEVLIFGEYVDGVFVPTSAMDIVEYPDGIVEVTEDPLEVDFTKRAENVTVKNIKPVAYILDYEGDYYNGIQSIDLTRIYDGTFHESQKADIPSIIWRPPFINPGEIPLPPTPPGETM